VVLFTLWANLQPSETGSAILSAMFDLWFGITFREEMETPIRIVNGQAFE
jgi:hypothetical protein